MIINPFYTVKAGVDVLVDGVGNSLRELKETYDYIKFSYLIPRALQETENLINQIEGEMEPILSSGSHLEKIALTRGLDAALMFKPIYLETKKAFETGLDAWLFINGFGGVRARDIADLDTLKGFRYGLSFEGNFPLYDGMSNPVNHQQTEYLIRDALEGYNMLIPLDNSFSESMVKFRKGLKLAYCSVHGWDKATVQSAEEMFRL